LDKVGLFHLSKRSCALSVKLSVVQLPQHFCFLPVYTAAHRNFMLRSYNVWTYHVSHSV